MTLSVLLTTRLPLSCVVRILSAMRLEGIEDCFPSSSSSSSTGISSTSGSVYWLIWLETRGSSDGKVYLLLLVD